MSKQVCNVRGCRSLAVCRGWCDKHYTRWKRHGDPLKKHQPYELTQRPAPKLCTIEECQDPHEARGLCSLHYQRLRSHGSPNPGPGGAKFQGVEFLKSLVEEEPDGECRDWPFGTKGRYGATSWGGRQVGAHRVVLELDGRPSPGPWPEFVAMHLCNRAICVAPWHLAWGTPASNNRHAAGTLGEEIILTAIRNRTSVEEAVLEHVRRGS